MLKIKSYVKVKSIAEAYELNQKKTALVLGGMVWLKMGNETDIQKRKQNPALYDNRNDSHQSAVWNTMEGIAEKCSGMVGQYLSGVLFFRMGSVWLRCRKISIRTEAKDILLACESY